MKGLQEQTDSGAVFLVVKHNSICEESKKQQDGFEPVEVMNPTSKETSIKFIKRYKAVEALITKIEWRDTEYQYDQRYVSWKIYLDADGIPCVLELPFNSRVSSRFMKLAENIDFSKPVEFRAWRDTKTDSTAFFVGQTDPDGKVVSVHQKYTKDEPGDCPPPVKKIGGKWNFDDQMDFLHDRMMTVVIPTVAATATMTHNNGDEPPFDDSEPDEIADDNDIPF